MLTASREDKSIALYYYCLYRSDVGYEVQTADFHPILSLLF